MPNRKPKRSYVLPVVTAIAVAAPIATLLHIDSGYRPANESELAAIPAELAEVAVATAPDVVLPLQELTGLSLPDLHLSDLIDKDPASKPSGLGFISAPEAAHKPALAPDALPPEVADQVGAQVKEISRDAPFSMVALTADSLRQTTTMLRAKHTDGRWGQWYEAEPVDSGVSNGTAGTEPIYVGETHAVQVLTTHPHNPPAPGRHTVAAPTDQVFPDLTAVLIDPRRSALDGALHEVAAALPGGGPRVITRAQWGADESLRCEPPTYDDILGGVTVHHTAGRNDYSKAESAGIVRAIYTYHAQKLGWCDIGYNALVDKYGQIFEGRYGGLDRPVQGAHAGGFNENTAGVTILGNYENVTPSSASIDSVGRYVGWRTKIAGLNPLGQTVMWSEGTEFTPYARGEEVQLPVVFAHRDVGNTTCPGDAAYALMDRIRAIAAKTGGSGSSSAGETQTSPEPSDPEQSTPQPDLPAQQARSADVETLTELTSKLLGMVEENLVAKHWASTGGAEGHLGQPIAEPLPSTAGQQYGQFVNGNVYSTPEGLFEVAGQILDRFLALGGASGMLGLPLSNAYPVPDGMRTDFQNGALILNTVTGIVTTVWKTYNDTYQQEMGQNPEPAPTSTTPAAPLPE